MTRLLHTGDTHIGYQQYHSPERRADFLAAFERVVDDAVQMDVDAVVHAGDLFHDRRPDLPDLLGTLSALRRLAAAGVPFLAVVGNHESARGGQWLDLFERLDLATRLGSDPVVVDSVALYGLDHVPPSRRDALEYDFTRPAETELGVDPTHRVLVGHGLFTPFAHADWETETVLDASTVDFDAVLLGDNHTPGIERVDGVWVTYCGSTERASAAEREGRGYNVVDFDDEVAGPDGVEIRRRSLSTREFVFVNVALDAEEGVDRVRERVGQHDLGDAVVIVEITGGGEPVAPADVETFALDRGALIARVTDRREVDTETELSVRFADPDAAVDERVAALGLSAAAHEVDEAVRSPELAETNLRETVRGRLEESLDSDPEAFVPAESERDDGGDVDHASDGNGVGGDEVEPVGDRDVDGSDQTTGGDDGGTEVEAAENDMGAIEDEEAAGVADDGLTTMEDFL